MPRHEFGIMQTNPKKKKRYDYYEPDKYDCISVDDDDLLSLLKSLNEVKCYWHTLERTESGLAYYGITLIPPALLALLTEAQKYNKYVIHFGI